MPCACGLSPQLKGGQPGRQGDGRGGLREQGSRPAQACQARAMMEQVLELCWGEGHFMVFQGVDVLKQALMGHDEVFMGLEMGVQTDAADL